MIPVFDFLLGDFLLMLLLVIFSFCLGYRRGVGRTMKEIDKVEGAMLEVDRTIAAQIKEQAADIEKLKAIIEGETKHETETTV